MYNKTHKAIRENAEAQNCKKLLKLIDLADFLDLKFVYAYKRHFHNPENVIRYIEVIDLFCKKNFDFNLIIIKNETKGSFINISYKEPVELVQLDYKVMKKYTKRITIANQFLQELNKFNLNDLPNMGDD